MFDRAAYQLESGKMQSYAFPGGYPLYYVCKDGGTLCPDCAASKESREATPDCPDDAQWYLVGAECNYEDTALFCDHCGKRIESAYCEEETEGAPDDSPNLDGMAAEDLQAYYQEKNNPALLREYAALKARAIDARLGGKIPQALQWESACDALYKQLPQYWQW